LIIGSWLVVGAGVPGSKVGEVVDIPFLYALLESITERRIHLSMNGVPLSKNREVIVYKAELCTLKCNLSYKKQ
jgi:hypothetical protein